jgi:hypothetical protein
MTILRDLFGAGTWGTGGNLVASALLTVPTVIITHVRAYRQRERHQEELKQHVTDTMGGSR